MSRRLEGRLIALGVTGSIAAYKAVELLRLLTAEGADVVALLSPSAQRFVGPLSFAALSRHPVETDVLDLLPDGRIGHIVIADSADAFVVAPATAHWLGAMANGLAGDVVTAAALATSAPIVVAPAMDGEMWTHPATVANVARLRDVFGYTVVSPEAGPLASGQSGIGRLAELPAIVDAVVAALAERPIRQPNPMGRPPLADGPAREADLVGRHIVVTAGGTREPIDPVRYIGNRSTGRMGAALAEAALARGARVTLLAAAVEVALPVQADVIHVETTDQLRRALTDAMSGSSGSSPDALIMAAAVADFTPTAPSDRKLPRREGLTLALSPTPDLLAEAAAASRDAAAGRGARPVLVGFAAETGSLDRATEKLRAKGVDLLVANDVSEPGSGFGTETNRVTILDRDDGADELPMLGKREVADRILDRVVAALDARDAAAQTAETQPQPT
ncbi:MAG TPA: bifunctional phosphopantothenoylcysteine decarboxylase/phosphopantothenate synthase [Candidatus Limnocylindrales bacterium]|jgi:phosphopantothenoylcysteine decarboxylase/phosphopantothenate--cysteine ligase|nr:bifunctional phosphopantothenoylcysteine decarboxylase/phosphopantothenate synthase [Candidatus Limnocylindrales bacterium]